MTPALQSLNTISIASLAGFSGTESENTLLEEQFIEAVWEDEIQPLFDTMLTDEQIDYIERITENESVSEQDKVKTIEEVARSAVPNLSDIWNEVSAQARLELLSERMNAMREYLSESNQAEKLPVMDQAQQLVEQEQYIAAVDLLNELVKTFPEPAEQ